MAWFFNRAKPIVFLQLPLIVLFLTIGHKYVAFKAVASNTLGSLNSPGSVAIYAVKAFQNTEPLVAFLAVAIGLFTILALNSIARNVIALSKKPARLPIRLDK